MLAGFQGQNSPLLTGGQTLSTAAQTHEEESKTDISMLNNSNGAIAFLDKTVEKIRNQSVKESEKDQVMEYSPSKPQDEFIGTQNVVQDVNQMQVGSASSGAQETFL